MATLGSKSGTRCSRMDEIIEHVDEYDTEDERLEAASTRA